MLLYIKTVFILLLLEMYKGKTILGVLKTEKKVTSFTYITMLIHKTRLKRMSEV